MSSEFSSESEEHFAVGDNVEAEAQSGWKNASILKKKGNKYFVHFDGFSKQFDIWVNIDQLRHHQKKKKKKKVGGASKVIINGEVAQLERGMKVAARMESGAWKDATIADIDPDLGVKVDFDGYSAQWDVWIVVDSGRLCVDWHNWGPDKGDRCRLELDDGSKVVATVKKRKPSQVLLSYRDGRQVESWEPLDSGNIEDVGEPPSAVPTHKEVRTVGMSELGDWNKAATFIAAYYKGYKVRKELQEMHPTIYKKILTLRANIAAPHGEIFGIRCLAAQKYLPHNKTGKYLLIGLAILFVILLVLAVVLMAIFVH